MADLTKSTLPLKTRQRTFQDPSNRIFTPAVALVDESGVQAGTLKKPLSVTDPDLVLGDILSQLRILNQHMQLITNETFVVEDT